MKILIVTNMYPSKQKAYSGIFVKNQFEGLKSILDAKDTLAIFYMKRQFTSKFGSLIKYIKTVFRFLPFLFKKYDIVHLHYFFPLIILVWLYKKFHHSTKIVVTFHGSDINRQVNDKNKFIYRFFAQSIDFTIPVGKDLAVAVESKLNLKTGKVLSVGIDHTIFYKELNKENCFDYIFVGSFFHIKGIDILLKVIKDLPKHFSFCIVGKGEIYEAEIKQMIKDGYNITLKIDQSQNDLRHLLNKSRFLVQPSREEGFGLVVAEAMFCGVPAIVSNVGGFKEQVVQGKNGYFFDKEGALQLHQYLLVLKDITKQNYDKLCDNALNSSKELSLQNVCKELYVIYKNLDQNA
jgi:glycosyltransferase involved in cell wall biosynthesis